jgi:hypothetical protein
VSLSGQKSMRVKFDTDGLFDYLDAIPDKVQESLIPAAAVGAKVLYDRVKLNVAALGSVTGKLDESIYRVLSKDKSSDHKAVYHISWNHRKAPHGHLVEYGYMQRYAYYQTDDGQVRIRVRPEAAGKRKPGRHASQAEKNAYWVTLATPKHVPGKAFVRSAASSFPEAYSAAETYLWSRVLGN